MAALSYYDFYQDVSLALASPCSVKVVFLPMNSSQLRTMNMEISVMKKAMVGGLSIGLCSLGLMLSGCSSDDQVEASANATLKQATASNGTCADRKSVV